MITLFQYSCKNIKPDCDWMSSSDNYNDLFIEIKQHWINTHDIQKFPQTLLYVIEDNIFEILENNNGKVGEFLDEKFIWEDEEEDFRQKI